MHMADPDWEGAGHYCSCQSFRTSPCGCGEGGSSRCNVLHWHGLKQVEFTFCTLKGQEVSA